MSFRSIICLFCLISLPLMAQSGDKKEAGKEAAKKAPDHFIRHVEVGRRAQLQTSVVTYKKKKVTVDLVGAVHIGDEKYFEKLNELFKEYDVLLFELVAPADVEIGELERAQLNQVRNMQVGMKKALGLSFQMDTVDYTPDNFVHADMDIDEFLKSQKQQGESFMKLYLDAMAMDQKKRAAGQPSGPSMAELAELLLSPDRGMSLKLVLSRQLADLGGEMEMMEGSVIIDGRNKKAFEVLDAELKKDHKRIGIFYGAAHMPDMEERLVKRGFKRKKVEWVSAWNMYQP